MTSSQIKCFTLGFVPQFLVEYHVNTFNLNRPKCDSTKDVPYVDLLNTILRNPFTKEGLYPVEAIIVARANPTTFVHDEGHPLPCPICLDAVPKLIFNRYTSVRKV